MSPAFPWEDGMAAELLPMLARAGDTNNNPMSGAVWRFYESGTSTPQAVYADADLNTSLGVSVTADGAGKFVPIYLDATLSYRGVLKSSDGATTIFDIDPINSGVAAVLAAGGGAALVGFLQAGAGSVLRTVSDKLKDTVSVEDFMTTAQIADVRAGTALVDVTEALQTAFDAHLAVDFPPGIYRISDTLTARDGTYLRGVGATLKQTEDLTSMLSIGGNSNITIEGLAFEDTGTGHVASDAQPHAAIIGTEGADNIKIVGCTFTGITFAAIRLRESDNVDISHNTFVGPGAGVLAYGSNLRCYPILIDALSTHFRIAFNDISDALHGMRIGRSSGGVIVGNVIHGIPAQHGVYAGPECNDLAIAHNVFRDIALQAIKLQAENGFDDNTNVSIVGNVITTCDMGITVSNAAGGAAQAVQNFNIVIADNTILDCVDTGINIQNAVNSQVTDNMVETTGGPGINFSACDYLTVATNRLISIGDSGIRDQSPCTNVSIESNKLHNVAINNTASDNYGIFVQDLTGGYSIRRNRTTLTSGSMLHSLYCTGDQSTTVLADNEFYGATGQAMRCAGATSAFAMFKNNILEGATGAAFNVPAIPSVASAATITLSTQHDFFNITGTTGITAITAAGHTGHRVTLKFADALTVTRGGVLILNQAAGNFVTTANDTLTLISDGSNWYEISRSAN